MASEGSVTGRPAAGRDAWLLSRVPHGDGPGPPCVDDLRLVDRRGGLAVGDGIGQALIQLSQLRACKSA